MTQEEFEAAIRRLIDELKAMTNELGLSNTGTEFKIIGELFTFKFLNDKLIHSYRKRENKDETFEKYVELAGSNLAKMELKHTIPALFKQQDKPNFAKIFDKALTEISKTNNKIYSIVTTTGQEFPLFEPLAHYIRDEKKEQKLAQRAINILHAHDFSKAFNSNIDFFRTIFEYLVKDYNSDSGGKYAEFFTPQKIADIMAEMLVGEDKPTKVSVYDPTAGSGTLLMGVANKIGTNNCTIYSQDISQKSSTFLRINLILNNLAHSLNNIAEGNTLENPVWRNPKDENELKQFDYIVSNPPFKLDFSASLPVLEDDIWERFFAGLPNIPKKDKSKMAIYPAFIQHVIASMSDTGKAAIVLPTGFVSAQAKIEKTIRKHIVDNEMLLGVIHMPSNIFATTGTSVSVIFLDKNGVEEPMFVDASKLGEQLKIDGEQRTVLSDEDVQKIVDSFVNREIIDNFSCPVKLDKITSNGFSFQAGSYLPSSPDTRDYDVGERLEELKEAILANLDEKEQLIPVIRENLSSL